MTIPTLPFGKLPKKSSELMERARNVTPGGVHSPVRSFKGLHRAPIFFERASGAYLHDVEGNSYIDFCMSFGPLILGHADPSVGKELENALHRGWSYGAAEPYSLQLAEYIIERIPFVEQIRFVNSGTEAVMTAIRLARGFSGREKIVKFNGCYHGHMDAMLIKAGSGVTALAEASSKGIPQGVAKDTLVLELDDIAGVQELFSKHGKEIAAVIVEPLPANNGLLVQREEFLQELRTLTKQSGALLIFDEVISGFRVAFGGMSELLSITPDLVTYGKIIGGGMPVGAVAGRREIMEQLAPVGSVYQAGTLSANPLAMIAGMATLQTLNNNFYATLEKSSQTIAQLFQSYFSHHKSDAFKHLQVHCFQSLFWITPRCEGPIRAISKIPSTLSSSFAELFKVFLEKGIYLAPNAYEVGFVSSAHDESVISELQQKLTP
ncbi:MAG: glutamate-1-semialdehyde 2,1-aminomutase [Oligoflexia bacterium]|nr:glutamate-1-semialdehyde 2,1-aminomutase [Oligoflexia bacterium]